jgi:hypothetical protein
MISHLSFMGISPFLSSGFLRGGEFRLHILADDVEGLIKEI